MGKLMEDKGCLVKCVMQISLCWLSDKSTESPQVTESYSLPGMESKTALQMKICVLCIENFFLLFLQFLN